MASPATDSNRITCVDTSGSLVAAGTVQGDVVIYRLQPSTLGGGRSNCYSKKIMQVRPPRDEAALGKGLQQLTCVAISPANDFIAIGSVAGLVVVLDWHDRSDGSSNLNIFYDHREHGGYAITALKWSMNRDNLKLFSGCEAGFVNELNISSILKQQYNPNAIMSLISLLSNKPITSVCKTPLAIEAIDCSLSPSSISNGATDLLLVCSAGQLLLFSLPADGTSARVSQLRTKSTYKDIERAVSSACFINHYEGGGTTGDSICVLSRRITNDNKVAPVVYICDVCGSISDERILTIISDSSGSDRYSPDFTLLSLQPARDGAFKGILFGVTSDSCIAAVDLVTGTLAFVDFLCGESCDPYFRGRVHGVSAGPEGSLVVLHEEGVSGYVQAMLLSVNAAVDAEGGVVACYDMGLRAAATRLQRTWRRRRGRRPLLVDTAYETTLDRLAVVERALGTAIESAIDSVALCNAGVGEPNEEPGATDSHDSAKKALRRLTLELVSRGVDNFACGTGGDAAGVEGLLREADGVVRITRLVLHSSSSSRDDPQDLFLDAAMTAEQLMDASDSYVRSPHTPLHQGDFERGLAVGEAAGSPLTPNPNESSALEPSFLRDSAPLWSDLWSAAPAAHPLKSRIGRLKRSRCAFYSADMALLSREERVAHEKEANISEAFQSSSTLAATITIAPSSVILCPPPRTYSVTVTAPSGLGLNLALSTSGDLRVSGFSDLDSGDRSPCKLCGRIAIGDALVSINEQQVRTLTLDQVWTALTACCGDNGGEVALTFTLAAYCEDNDVASGPGAAIHSLLNPLQYHGKGSDDYWAAPASDQSIFSRSAESLLQGVDELVRTQWLLQRNHAHDGALFGSAGAAPPPSLKGAVESSIRAGHMYPGCAAMSALPASMPSPAAQLDSLAEELWEWRREHHAAQQSMLFASNHHLQLPRCESDLGARDRGGGGAPFFEDKNFQEAVVRRLRGMAVDERRSHELRGIFFMKCAALVPGSGLVADAPATPPRLQEREYVAVQQQLLQRARCEEVLRLQHLQHLRLDGDVLSLDDLEPFLAACAQRQRSGDVYIGMHASAVALVRRLPPSQPTLCLLYSVLDRVLQHGGSVTSNSNIAVAYAAAQRQWQALFDPCPFSQRAHLRDLYSNFLEASAHDVPSGMHLRELVLVVEDLLGLQLSLHLPLALGVQLGSRRGAGGRCFTFLPLCLDASSAPDSLKTHPSPTPSWRETDAVAFISRYAAHINLDACAVMVSLCEMKGALETVLALALAQQDYSRATETMLSALKAAGAGGREVKLGAVFNDMQPMLPKDFDLAHCLVLSNLGYMFQKFGDGASVFAAGAFPRVSSWNVRRALLGDACDVLRGGGGSTDGMPPEWVHNAKRLYHRYLTQLVYKQCVQGCGDDGEGEQLSFLLAGRSSRDMVLREWLPLSLYLCTCDVAPASSTGDEILKRKIAGKLRLRETTAPRFRTIKSASGSVELTALDSCDALALLCVMALSTRMHSPDATCAVDISKAFLAHGFVDVALRTLRMHVSARGCDSTAAGAAVLLLEACLSMVAVIETVFFGEGGVADNEKKKYAVKTATLGLSLLHHDGSGGLPTVVSAISNSVSGLSGLGAQAAYAQVFSALLVGALGAPEALELVAGSDALLQALDASFFASVAVDSTTFVPNATLLE